MGLGRAPSFETNRRCVCERHRSALNAAGELELLEPLFLQIGVAVLFTALAHVCGSQIAYRLVISIVHLLEAGAYKADRGHERLSFRFCAPNLERRLREFQARGRRMPRSRGLANKRWLQ